MTQSGSVFKSISDDHSDRQTSAEPYIDRILRKLAKLVLPAKDHLESYMRHKWRVNLRPSTLKGSFQALSSFLTFYASMGKSQIQDVLSSDIEKFVEHEQDRGLNITTVNTRLKALWAFLRFLSEQDIIDGRILRRKVKVRVPDFLPRAIAPGDIKKILGAIKEIRDRALLLVLLRTGMRIGEVLGLKVIDLDVRERKINIYQGEKNCVGRVVYLSDDVLMAIKLWLAKRDTSKEYLFYGAKERMCYTSARNIFLAYLRKTELENKGTQSTVFGILLQASCSMPACGWNVFNSF